MSTPRAEHVHVVAAGRTADVAVYRARAPRLATLVFVHGAGCDHHIAEPLAEALPELDIVAPDLPGRGGAPGAPCATAAEAAVFVGAVMDALEVPRAFVLGHSYGGAIALELAFARPLAGLVLASTGARLRVHPGVLEAVRVQAETSTESAGLFGWSDDVDPLLAARLDVYARAVPAATSLVDWRAANAFDRIGALGGLHVPTLVLAGELDVLTPPKYAHYLAAQITAQPSQSARLELLPASGHMLPIEHAARIAPLVRAFVSSAC